MAFDQICTVPSVCTHTLQKVLEYSTLFPGYKTNSVIQSSQAGSEQNYGSIQTRKA